MLEDVNDEIPLFTEREQETVLEGEPVGSKVTQVNAIDKDGTFPNNQVNGVVIGVCRCARCRTIKRTYVSPLPPSLPPVTYTGGGSQVKRDGGRAAKYQTNYYSGAQVRL